MARTLRSGTVGSEFATVAINASRITFDGERERERRRRGKRLECP
jgi:hypothetical protein